MTTKLKLILIVGGIVLCVAAGIGFKTWRVNKFIAGADAREAKRMEEIRAKENENSTLRGMNEQLRKDNSALEVKALAQEQIITERGGSIVREQQKLEAITERQKNEEAAINADTDTCTRCRDLSTNGVKAGIFDKPLDCSRVCKQ